MEIKLFLFDHANLQILAISILVAFDYDASRTNYTGFIKTSLGVLDRNVWWASP